jgi:hypothetical protein
VTVDAKQTARRAGDNPAIEWGARLGYAASGVLHLLLAWLAAQVALGGGGKQASQSGALNALARQPFGEVLLWLLAAGFLLLAVWQVTEAVARHEMSDKVKAVGKLVAYGALAWTAFKFATGGHSSSNKQTRDFTVTVMKWPGGPFLVGAVGLGILAIGGYHVYKGLKKKFYEDLQEHPGRWAEVSGQVGYVAKGVALGAVGVLFIVAAFQHQGGKATGLDGALRSLRDLPAGELILLGIALGLAAFGVYCFARARYARV